MFRRQAAGKLSATDAFEEWRARRRAGDMTATLIDLYAAVARPSGLQPWELPLTERMQLARLALPEIYPGFEFVADTERPAEPITLVAYDPAWPQRFGEWRRKLAEKLRLPADRIHHIGSTAVPGLISKDVVDILVGVERLQDESSYVPAIESVGVQLRSRDDQHRYFRPFSGRPRDVQVHVCNAGSEWERRHLLFVDYLRHHPAAREKYAQEKGAALAHWANDRAGYPEAKDAVIREIDGEAEEWARVTGWTVVR